MNHFVNFYIDNVINTFRVYNDSLFNVNIQGLGLFANKEDRTFAYLLSQLANYGFNVNINTDNEEECFCVLTIIGENQKTGEVYNFCYNAQDLLCLINLSSKTKVSVECIMVMKIIAMFVCRFKILYKAIVLDLDDTLWNGTLSEEGIEKNEIGIYHFISYRFSKRTKPPRFASPKCYILHTFLLLCLRATRYSPIPKTGRKQNCLSSGLFLSFTIRRNNANNLIICHYWRMSVNIAME